MAGKFTTLIAASVVTAISALSTSTPSEAARWMCFEDHFHYGSSGLQPTRAKAQKAAVESWASFVVFEYGSAYGNFYRSASRKMSCSRHGKQWQCNAEGRPCRRAR